MNGNFIMGRAFAAWFLVAFAAAAPVSAPREVVQSAVSRVIAVIHADEDTIDRATRPDGDKRRAEIRQAAAELFDFDEMSRRALGRHWWNRSRAEQTEFVTLFTELLERSYLSRIEAYAGEKIMYVGDLVDGNYATVRSRVFGKRRTETSLDYRMYLDDGRWKAFDIAVDGVSFISTYRSEFNRIIQASSYSSLVDRMRKKRLEIDPLSRRADRR